ncbi:hypothetical protein Y032_0255g324 [Ancylostoma ceylanicum]|uniref:Transthyretin-like family protein n=1 Tax=Ancylostoma ceylanicum TaxID=53326 RepID=A0A016SB79_9BILA|nr:hypothetical protein Y032_0255g324 [Ancylostoma ceylanicum]
MQVQNHSLQSAKGAMVPFKMKVENESENCSGDFWKHFVVNNTLSPLFRCSSNRNPCSRKIKFTIPKKFIHNGNPTPEQWIDIGVINLEGAFDDEGRECVN